ncbi:MAG TPA: PspC domain-containing protein [Pseudonocardiaceae bacterium]|nr:PspC domain-containing protein [Pseudonocardiaceae bacterium]
MNVQDTVRDFWVTRARRPEADRKIGGVAAAIARRYAIDVVLVRVAFVVAAFLGGAGVLLYLLGWLLLPAEGDQVSAAESLLGRGHSSMSTALTLLLGVALIPATGMVFGGDAYGVLGLAMAGAALFLLHRSRATLGEIPSTGPVPTGPVPTGSAPTGSAPTGSAPDGSVPTQPADPVTAPVPAPGTGGAQPSPPAWDPLSAAPFAWDLPEPRPVPPPAPQPRRHRSKVTPITLGLALLAGGIAAAFWPALSLAQITALVLGVVGLGLVAGALVHGGRGLIVAAVPLALLAWVLHAVSVSGFRVGEQVWTPVTVAQVQPRYEVTMGNGFLDLTGLRVPAGQTVTTHVAVGAGEARVAIPPEVDAEVACQAPAGTVSCLGVSSSGVPARVNQYSAGSGAGKLVLDVRAGLGNVQVVRGS